MSDQTPFVLVHGGGFAGSCWDLLLPHLDAPAMAVDLPGRGRHPGPPSDLTIESATSSIIGDIDESGFDEVVLVGHSLAGCSLPATIGRLGNRVRHVVFVACTVPPDGEAAVDTLPEEVRAMVREARDAEPGIMDEATSRMYFGNDLDQAQFTWCQSRMVPEGLRILSDPVDLSPLRSEVARTWIRPTRDAIIDPARQLTFAEAVGHCPVVDLDAGHMCMISQPEQLGRLLNTIAASR